MGSKIGRWVLRGVLAVVTLAVLVVSCLVLFWQELPYQAFLSRYMLHMLSERGVQASLQLEYLGKDRAILSGIRIGEEAPLRVGQMTLQYTLPELMKRKLRRVALQEVDVTLQETREGWQVSGLEPLMAQAPSESSESAFSVFDAAPLMAALPEQILLQNGTVYVKGTGWSTTVPLEITISGKEKVAVTATSTRPSFRRKPYTANAAALQVEAQLADGIWQGTAALPGIAVEGAPVQLPLMTAQMTADVSTEQTVIAAQLQGTEARYQADMTLSFPTEKIQQGTLNIRKLQFPWGGGIIALDPLVVNVAMDAPIPLTIHLREVELTTLLGRMSGDKIRGSGKVSGAFPLIYYPDGHVQLQEGSAQAANKGVISVPPELLPGENAQLAVARKALESFHYTALKITVSSESERKSTIRLTLEGNNPEALEGRLVKLNVALGGDILPLVQQSLLPLQNVKQLLEIKDTP